MRDVGCEGDKCLEKLSLYGRIATRELLVVHRDPWKLELYRLAEADMELAATSAASSGNVASSKVLDFSFQLVTGTSRPAIEVIHGMSQKQWHL